MRQEKHRQYRNLLMYCNTFSKAERKYSSNTWIHFHAVYLKIYSLLCTYMSPYFEEGIMCLCTISLSFCERNIEVVEMYRSWRRIFFISPWFNGAVNFHAMLISWAWEVWKWWIWVGDRSKLQSGIWLVLLLVSCSLLTGDFPRAWIWPLTCIWHWGCECVELLP